MDFRGTGDRAGTAGRAGGGRALRRYPACGRASPAGTT